MVRLRKAMSCTELREILAPEHFSAGCSLEVHEFNGSSFLVFVPILDAHNVICIPCGKTRDTKIRQLEVKLMGIRDIKSLMSDLRLFSWTSSILRHNAYPEYDKNVRRQAKQLIAKTGLELKEALLRDNLL